MTRSYVDGPTKWVLDAADLWYTGLAKFLPHSVTLGQLRVLTQILKCQLEETPCTPSDLARQLEMPRSTVSRIVRQLADDDTISAEHDPKDDRRVLLKFTDEYLKLNRQWVDYVMQLRSEMAKKHPAAYKVGPESKDYFG